jgi:hypothetical protein
MPQYQRALSKNARPLWFNLVATGAIDRRSRQVPLQTLLSKSVFPEVMRMHDAQKFSLNHEVDNIAHKDEYKQYNRLQSLLFC